MSKEFRFQQFKISQDRSVWRVSTDSVLLGAWTQLPEGPLEVLDVGIGTGVLALMIAQRYPEAGITGIEIDPATAAEAQENVNTSPWGDRIRVVAGDVCQFIDSYTGHFDVVISNPPYFNNGAHSPKQGKRLARHGASFNAHTLARLADVMLKPTGQLAVVIPWADAALCITEYNTAGLYVHRRLNAVHHGSSAVPSLCCLEFRRTLVHPAIASIAITSGGRRSAEYEELTHTFLI